MNAPLLFVGIGVPELLLLLCLVLLPIALTIYALVDVVRHDFRHPNDKVIWVLVILLLPIVGPVLFLLIGRNQRLIS